MLFASPEITVYCLFLAVAAGAASASFMNCIAWRAVRGESFFKGRSHCDCCGHLLSAGDLIPIFSYLVRRGRCRYCGNRLSITHLIYELIGAVVFSTLMLKFDISFELLEYLLFASILMGAAFADIDRYLIPDGFIIAGIILRAGFILFTGSGIRELADALIGGFGVAAVLLMIVLVTEKVMKREAMGGGDIKLICMIGLFLGWKKNLLMLFTACIIGIGTAFLTQERREREDSSEDKKIFPWGPSLAIAAYLTLLFGDALISRYLSLF